MTSHNPKISIVTICYNIVNEIEKTLVSVCTQTYKNKEYIVVDGASQDGTLDIINRYSKNIDCLISEPDHGIYDAMNKAIEQASGDYIVFINGGDCLTDPEILNEIAEELTQKNLPDIYYTNSIDDHYGILRYRPARHCKWAWYGMFTSHQAIYYSLRIIKKYALVYDTSYKVAADYKFTLEHLSLSRHTEKSNLYTSRFFSGGISQTNRNIGLIEADRARKEVQQMNLLFRKGIVLLQICARLFADYGGAIYRKLRFQNQ